MFGWLGGIGSWFGGQGGGDTSGPVLGGGAYQGLNLNASPDTIASLLTDRMRSDLMNYPFRGPGDLDRDGGETAEMRGKYRLLYQREGVVTSAIDGKVEGVAAARVTIEPFDRTDPRSRDEAEFLDWSVNQGEGWDTIGADVLRPAFIDGWSVLEVTLKEARHPRHGTVWALRHCRSLDTRFLRLQMDPFRNITGVVSMVRGLESFSPDKVLIYTHRRMFHNHFGTSDMRPVYRDANLLQDAYTLWYMALKLYGEPFIVGTMKRPEVRKQFEGMLEAMRAGGWAAIQEGDKIELLSFATAVNFQAFEAKAEQLQKNIFTAVRGSALPFMQTSGGPESRGDTQVSEGKTDDKETLISRQLCRLYSKQLAPILLVPNYGPDVVHRLPRANIGGTDWKAKKEIMDTLSELREKFPGVVSLSKADIGVQLAFPPATGPDDEANPGPPPQGPDGGGGGDGKTIPPPGPGSVMPAGSNADGPAALPAAPAPAAPASDFAAEHAPRYADYVLPDRHGRYPGDLHAQFGLGVQAFADRTGLVRKAGKGGAWLWVPRPAVDDATKTFSADPAAGTDARTGTPGAYEAGVAMMEAYGDGDDALADALAGLADDPEGLAELTADVEAGTHGQPGTKALAAMVRTFASGTSTFGWVSDPTPRSKSRATNTESGTHAYGARAQQLLAAQGRADRGEPEPEKPQAKAQRLKLEREPAREKARAAWAKVTTAPDTLTADDLGALREHLNSLTRDEVRAAVKAVRGGGHGGKLKAELIDALKDHAREAMAGAAAKNVRPAATDPARLALAGMQPNRHKAVTADGEEVPAGQGYERWEGDRKVGYTAAQAAKVAAGVTAEEGQRRIAEHERAAADPKLDPFERDRHADTAAQLREHHGKAFPTSESHGQPDPANRVADEPAQRPTAAVTQDAPAAGRRVEMPAEEPAAAPAPKPAAPPPAPGAAPAQEPPSPTGAGHNVLLPKDKKRLTIDQRDTALKEIGYEAGLPTTKKVGNSLIEVYPLKKPDGTTANVTHDELRQLVYDGANHEPGLGKKPAAPKAEKPAKPKGPALPLDKNGLPAVKAGAEQKPDDPAYQAAGRALMSDDGFRKDLADSYNHQMLFVEHRDGLVGLSRLYHELQKRRPDVTVPQFHAAIDQLNRDRGVQLHALNEVHTATAEDRHAAIDRNDRFHNWVRFNGAKAADGRPQADPDKMKPADAPAKAVAAAPAGGRLDQLTQWAAAKPESKAARAAVERETARQQRADSGNSPQNPSTDIDKSTVVDDTTPVPATPAGGNGGKPMTTELPKLQGPTRGTRDQMHPRYVADAERNRDRILSEIDAALAPGRSDPDLADNYREIDAVVSRMKNTKSADFWHEVGSMTGPDALDHVMRLISDGPAYGTIPTEHPAHSGGGAS